MSVCMRSILFFLLFQVVTHAGGIAVVKQHAFHADDTAKPFVFQSVEDGGTVWIFTTSAQRLRYVKSNLIFFVDLPERFPDQIVKPEDIEPIRSKIQEIRDFSTRFPKAAPFLQKHLQLIDQLVAKYDSGKVKTGGQWITRHEYEEQISAAAAKAKEEADIRMRELDKKRAERIEFENIQRSKGLVEYNGEWYTPQEANKLRSEHRLNAKISKLINERSIEDSRIRIFQSLEQGALCQILDGTAGTVRTNFCYVRDIALAADNELYQGDLFYAGTYSYENQLGQMKTVAAYCVSRATAISYLRSLFSDPEQENTSEPEEPNPTANPNLPGALRTFTSFGSGFFIGNDGHFITNHHVIKGAGSIAIYHDGAMIEARLVASSITADLALLKITSELKVKGVTLSNRIAESGTEIFTLGYPNPGIQGTEVKVTKGIVSSLTGFKNDDTCYQIDAAIQPGNSGGPICSMDGRVIGVVVSKLDEIAVANQTGSISQNVNYAIKSTEVRSFLGQHGVEIETANPGPGGLKTAKLATYLVAVK